MNIKPRSRGIKKKGLGVKKGFFDAERGSRSLGPVATDPAPSMLSKSTRAIKWGGDCLQIFFCRVPVATRGAVQLSCFGCAWRPRFGRFAFLVWVVSCPVEGFQYSVNNCSFQQLHFLC